MPISPIPKLPTSSIRMPIINLLPWRETRQLRRRQIFCVALAVSMALTFALVAGAAQLARAKVSGYELAGDQKRAGIAAMQLRIYKQDSGFAAYQRQHAEFTRTRRLHTARVKQARILAGLPHTMVAGLTLDRLRYDPPAVQLQGSAESARHVSQWLAVLGEYADISNAELQALYVDETSEQRERQVYFYRIRLELNTFGLSFSGPGEGS